MPEQMKFDKDSFTAQTATILARIEALHEDVRDIKRDNNDIKNRVTILENYKYFLAGAVAFFSLASSYIVSYFKYKNILKQPLPLVLNRTEERSNPVDVRPDDLVYFDNSYFSVVTETCFYNIYQRDPRQLYLGISENEPGVFFSEKIWKPIALNHPFIVVGSVGFLQELRDRGYKTFSPFIDESYDSIVNDQERMDAIVSEIYRLCNLPEEDLIKFTYDIQSIVEFNSARLQNTSDFRVTKTVLNLLK